MLKLLKKQQGTADPATRARLQHKLDKILGRTAATAQSGFAQAAAATPAHAAAAGSSNGAAVQGAQKAKFQQQQRQPLAGIAPVLALTPAELVRGLHWHCSLTDPACGMPHPWLCGRTSALRRAHAHRRAVAWTRSASLPGVRHVTNTSTRLYTYIHRCALHDNPYLMWSSLCRCAYLCVCAGASRRPPAALCSRPSKHQGSDRRQQQQRQRLWRRQERSRVRAGHRLWLASTAWGLWHQQVPGKGVPSVDFCAES